jgi:signal transduction histidine kinase/DNA-binding response OmpR family regulator
MERDKDVYRFSFFVIFLFWGLMFSAPGRGYCQRAGLKYLKNYSRLDYGEHPQNWAILQDRRGVIYVGNNGGVLEFDGISWRLIPIKDNKPVRSLTIDDTGTIYIGSVDDIGFLSPQPNGSLQYMSLRKYLHNENLQFTLVRRTHTTEEGIYFRARDCLIRWDYKIFRIWKPQQSFDSSFVCNRMLYIRDKGHGLLKMAGESLTSVSGARNFADAEIFMMAPYDDQRILITTRLKGSFLYDGENVSPFPTEVDDYLEEKKLYHGIRLLSGDYALATLWGGLVIIDDHGRLKQIFDKKMGLQDDNIKYVYEDMQGNLWLGLNYGITRIEYASPFSIYDARADLPQTVISIARHRQALYVGTTGGLVELASPSEKFRLIPGMRTYCWHLLSVDEFLFAATSDGVYRIENNKMQKITGDRSYFLYRSKREKNRIWVGTAKGLVSLYLKNGLWASELEVRDEIKQVISTIIEDSKGNLWLAPPYVGGVLKIDFPTHMRQPVVTRYDTSHGLPSGEIRVFWAANHVMFATEKGIFRFDDVNKQFIPDTTLGDMFANVDKVAFRIVEDENKNIWVHSKSRNYQAVPQKDGTYKINQRSFLRLPRVQVNSIYPDGNTIWYGSNDNLIGFDTTIKKNYRQDFQALVRRVVGKEKTVIFDGDKKSEANSLCQNLHYTDRNLRFEFAAPFFEGESSTQFRYLLEGNDDEWSEWTFETTISYTNLNPGEYAFRVQAKNIYGHLSLQDVFQFRILTPWYKTWWAFLAYGILLSLMMYLTIKWWRYRALEQEKQKLEQIVEERTTEINEKNIQLEKQTLRLQEQSGKLQEMANVKSRFFTNISHEFRTPLTLIMGPLEKILSKSRDREQVSELKMMFRNSQRLLRLINQLLDLSKLDSGKMMLNRVPQNIIPFVKGVVSAFESLAFQKKINLNIDVEENEIILSFDPEKLEEVFSNLLLNALKFTPPGGKVTSSCRRGRVRDNSFPYGYVELSVQDTGVGIPRNQLPHIFDRFYQTGESRQSSQKGTGIGLALTRELVLLHQGKINVHSTHSSEGDNSGTEFVIRLPLGTEHPEAEEKSSIPELSSGNKELLDIRTQYMLEDEANETVEPVAEIGNPPDEESDPGARDKHIVLVVEDNADVRKFIRDPLEPGYTVVEARDGREGIDKAKEFIPDLIVSDIMMPGMDGYELCRVLKKDVKTSHIPIILLTAKASDQSVIEGLETGADDYITKPFNTRILMTRIKNLIDLRLQLQQKIQKQLMMQPAEISVSSVDQEFIKELQHMIEKNLSDPELNVELLSKKLYMNRSTLYRKIMALTGESPIQFIRSYRLKRGAQLLKAKFGNVSQVALEVGFSNMAYFARCFKEKFHQLPSAYQDSES